MQQGQAQSLTLQWKSLLLWNGVLNNQLRATRCSSVAAVDLQEVGAEIMVVILVEAQAELGHPFQVDILEIVHTQRLGIPLVYFGVCVGQHFVLAARAIEICKLQSRITTERTLADIRQQFAMRLEGIGAGDSCVFEHERDRGDDGILGQGGGIEGKDGAILFVGGIIANFEFLAVLVQGAANTAGFVLFQYPAVIESRG